MKKLKIIIMILTLSFGIASYVHAESDVVMDKSILAPPSSLELGMELSSFHYSEPGMMDEDGSLYGVNGSYTSHRPNNVMWRFAGRFSTGELEYDGATQGGTPLTMDTKDFILGLRGLLGYDYEVRRSIVTPLIGLGYRYWTDDSSEHTGGYKREIQYLYSPIGVETASPLKETWIWGLRAEYDLFWGGEVTSHLSDVQPSFNDPVNDQNFGGGYGLRSSLYFKRPENVSWPVSIEVFVRYWDIDASDIAPVTFHDSSLAKYSTAVGYCIEPANNTTEYGIRLSLLW